ncbi:MAG TPA: dihydrofolate reductase family protein [Flavitalea sp.]|nr:dihydrofolate reductase family protein [Flavitalea sp.]
MRKVVVSMNVTLDGFMSGSNCELDWHFSSWTKEMADLLYEQLSKADTILLGRITYNAMAAYWPAKALDLSFPREDLAFADLMNNYTKLVFSKTHAISQWSNSKLLTGDPADEILKLKQKEGKDIIIYGSGKIVNCLAKSHVIDEYRLWVHPVLLGKGKLLFKDLEKEYRLKLFKTKTFSSGVVLLYYKSHL